MGKEINLLKGPVLPTMTRLALPVMATSMLHMAYNLVDMIWIGSIGSDAVAAVGVAGMFTWFSNGLCMLAKIGGQVKVGHSLGAGKEKEAVSYAQHAMQMAVIIGMIFGMVCFLFGTSLMQIFHLTSPKVFNDAVSYLYICGGAVIIVFITDICTSVMMAMGNSKTPFQVNCVGLVINIILDPILIFGVGPVPKLGVIGAAIATISAQAVSLILTLWHAKKDPVILSKIRLFRPMNLSYVRQMLKISFPIALQEMIFSSISMTIASIVSAWGDAAIAAQKVGVQIESISWMTAEGFSAALSAFVAQNYGAGNLKRVREGYLKALGIMVLWGIGTGLLLIFAAQPIFSIFIHEEEVIPIGVQYLTIMGFSQVFMCIEITASGAFSGIGRTLPPSVEGIILTAARIPLALVLTKTPLGLSGVFWSITISSILKGIILSGWFEGVYRKLCRVDV